jgi:hypothetical protein
MIDSDCFVTNPINFEEIQVLPMMYVKCVFRPTKWKVKPGYSTDPLFVFQPTLISEIKSKYKVTATCTNINNYPGKLNWNCWHGIDSDNLPESATKLFDTMRVYNAIRNPWGYRFNFLKRLPPGFVTDQQSIISVPLIILIILVDFFFQRYATFGGARLEKSGDKRLIDYIINCAVHLLHKSCWRWNQNLQNMHPQKNL